MGRLHLRSPTFQRKLLQRLNGTRGQHRKPNTIGSVRHELTIASSESNIRETVWTCRVSLSIEDPDQAVSFPLDSQNATLISFDVNGEQFTLGSRLRWNENRIEWMPTEVGEATIELKFSPRVQRGGDGSESVAVDLIPIAFSRLTINSYSAINLHTNVTGGKFNEPFGRKEIALGPIKRFTASWRNLAQDLRRVPVEIVSSTEIALLGKEMLAKTQFTKLKDAVWPPQFDIECGDSWRLLDHRLGEYTFSEEVPASTKYRKRYRFIHSTSVEASSVEAAPLELYWIASPSTSNVVDALSLEVNSLRVTESFLHVMQSEDADWEMDGLQSWEIAPATKAFDWQTRRDVSIATYRRLNTHTQPFLKRIAQNDKPSAAAATELRFDANQVDVELFFRFASPVQLAAGTYLTLNSPQHVSRILIDNRDVPFSVSDDLSHVTILPLAKHDRVETVEIQASQSYAIDGWQSVPVQFLKDVDLSSHTIHSRRLIGYQFQWSGVSTTEGIDNEHDGNSKDWQGKPNLYLPAWHWRSTIADNGKQTVGQEASAGSQSDRVDAVVPQYRVERSQEVCRGDACIEMARQSKHWVCSVFGRVELNDQKCDGVLFELPSSLLSQFESKQRSIQFESPEVGRGLVFLFAESSSALKEFEFQFYIDSFRR